MPDDLTYRAVFERLWDAKSSQVVHNSQVEHAASLLAVFFEKAEAHVAIFSRRLNRLVYDRPELLKAAKIAVEKGVHIEIIVQEAVDPDSDFVRWISGIRNRDDNSRILLNRGPAPLEIGNLLPNFAFVDNRAYRYESNKAHFKAVASAFQPEQVVSLAELFRAIKDFVTKRQPYVSCVG